MYIGYGIGKYNIISRYGIISCYSHIQIVSKKDNLDM